MTESANDPYDLERFVNAQRGSYTVALEELRRGAKRSHWVWFILPQVVGLGSSSNATRYAIKSRAEAEAYLAHPILGARLRECAEALLTVNGKSAREIMGSPDDLKLKSSMTLFATVAKPEAPFQKVIDRYFEGIHDERTLECLAAE